MTKESRRALNASQCKRQSKSTAKIKRTKRRGSEQQGDTWLLSQSVATFFFKNLCIYIWHSFISCICFSCRERERSSESSSSSSRSFTNNTSSSSTAVTFVSSAIFSTFTLRSLQTNCIFFSSHLTQVNVLWLLMDAFKIIALVSARERERERESFRWWLIER